MFSDPNVNYVENNGSIGLHGKQDNVANAPKGAIKLLFTPAYNVQGVFYLSFDGQYVVNSNIGLEGGSSGPGVRVYVSNLKSFADGGKATGDCNFSCHLLISDMSQSITPGSIGLEGVPYVDQAEAISFTLVPA
jgi:hypothetical protein